MKMKLALMLALMSTPALAEVIYIPANVLQVTPIYQTYTEYTTKRVCETQRGSDIAGAIIGGAIGNQFGSGSGKDAMTILGAIAGADAGAKSGRTVCRNVSRPVKMKTKRPVGFEVTYELNGFYQDINLNWAPPVGSQIMVPVETNTTRRYKYDH